MDLQGIITILKLVADIIASLEKMGLKIDGSVNLPDIIGLLKPKA